MIVDGGFITEPEHIDKSYDKIVKISATVLNVRIIPKVIR